MSGRKAAYSGRETTWDELQQDQEAWQLGMDLKQFS
jgi:myo-inositol 2-dehydrogenase / D-chiro-inositol 1-dehydrogenase